MKAPYALLAAVAAGSAALVSAAVAVRSASSAGEAFTGLWTAQPTESAAPAKESLLQLTLRRRAGAHGDSNHSHRVRLADLKGLASEPVNAGAAAVSFTLERDAGTFAFEGSFRRGEGAGHFTFTPRPEFVAAMRGLGYGGLDDEKVYSMAVLDVSRGFVRELDALGYSRLDVDELMSLRIHGATPAFIRELKGLGYDHVRVDDLVSMRIHGVSPEFVRRVQARRGSVSVDRLVEMRIHGQEP